LNRFLLAATIFVFLALASSASATQVVVNSQDWKDVYSASLYASLNGMPAGFVTSNENALEAWKYWEKTNPVQLFESSANSFYPGYGSFLQAKGFAVTSESTAGGDALVFELARRSGVKNFVVTDGTAGYNAISVMPYAVQSRSFVLFAGKDNALQVRDFLRSVSAQKVIEYGFLPKAVTDALAEFTPEAINKGDKFSNNIEIAKKFLALKPGRQVIFTTGEFIEVTISVGDVPVVLLGMQRPTQQQLDFVRTEGISYATVIGNELLNSAKLLKDQSGNLSVFVKYGKGIPGQKEVMELDRFYLPRYDLSLSIQALQYNLATKQLEVTYKNTGAMSAFAQASIVLTTGGQRAASASDSAPFTIEAGEVRTRAYSADMSSAYREGQGIDANLTVTFGEDANAMDRVLLQAFSAIRTTDFADNTNLSIGSLKYDLNKRAFVLELSNAGEAAYAKAKITYSLNNEKITLIGNATQVSSPATVEFPQALTADAAQAAASQKALVSVDYGARQDVLLKNKAEERQIEIIGGAAGIDWLIVIIAVLAVVAAALLAYLFVVKKKPHHAEHAHHEKSQP